MASRSRQPAVAAKESILTSVLTLEGHTKSVPTISYFPDGKRMISGSCDGTARQWDLEAGKEIEEARDVGMREVDAVAVSRDGRWVVLGGGDTFTYRELRVREVATEIVRRFIGHSRRITCIDISPDSTLLASGSNDLTVRIWSLDTGKIVAGPFQIGNTVGAVQFSQNSKKIAVISNCLDVWNVETQKLDVRRQNCHRVTRQSAPVLWTTKNTIVAAFGFTMFDPLNTIYEFDASTLETVRTPFNLGYIGIIINGLALSFDCALLASTSNDDTIKLWACESRQLLASFHVQNPYYLIFSPDSRQLAYTCRHNSKIHLCNTPPEILASIRPAQQVPHSIPPPTQKKIPTIGSQPPPSYPHPRELLPSSSHTDPVLPVQNDEPDDLPPEAILQDLSKYITKDGDYPIARGGFGEIWKCIYHNDQRSIKVAVKALLVYAADRLGEAETKKIKRINHELRICAYLKHENILPLYGYTYGFGPFMALVSPWADNGNLTAYLECEGADLTVLRRFQILRDIIAGLQYLHVNRVIHGDFTAPNVLIHGDGTACIADFGLSLMYSEVTSASQASWTSTLKGNTRWMAPELLVFEQEDGPPPRPSEQSDIYSFGGIMLQVLTNKTPYYYLPNDGAIVLCIVRSQKPFRSRYPELPEKYWEFIELCWSADPGDRPSTEGANGVIRNEYDALSDLYDS